MWRWVIKDYFAAFRWEKIKAWLKKGEWFWVFYFLFLVPVMCGFFETKQATLTYYLMVAPVGYCLAAEALHENMLPKMFYICPMDKEERKGYVKRKFLFAMLVPVFLGAVFAIVLWGMKICRPFTAIIYWVNVAILGIMTSSCFGKRKVSVPDHSSLKGETLYTGGAVETSDLLISMFAIMGMGIMLCDFASEESWAVWIFVSVAVFIQLPLTVKYLSGWNKAVENAVGYAKTKL